MKDQASWIENQCQDRFTWNIYHKNEMNIEKNEFVYMCNASITKINKRWMLNKRVFHECINKIFNYIYTYFDEHTSIWSPKGVLEEVDCCEDSKLCSGLASVRTSTLTGFLNPALESSSTASVWVAEKRPVLRSFGKREMIDVICFWNPISKSLSASSKIRICW